MNSQGKFTASTDDDEDYITVVSPSGQSSSHQLYHEGNQVSFDCLTHDLEPEAYDALYAELERLQLALYGKLENPIDVNSLLQESIEALVNAKKPERVKLAKKIKEYLAASDEN